MSKSVYVIYFALLLSNVFCHGLNAQNQNEIADFPSLETEDSHFYISLGSYIHRDFTEVEENPLFTEGYLKTAIVNFAAGYKFNPAISLELAIQKRSLTVSNSFGEMQVTSVYGITDMTILSVSMVNDIPLIPQRLWLKPKVGYVSGWHSLPIGYTGGSFGSNADLQTQIEREVLSEGRHNFLLLGLGIELKIRKRFSVALNYLRHQGFKNMARVETEYEYNGESGVVDSITNGSAAGFEFAVIYRFK